MKSYLAHSKSNATVVKPPAGAFLLLARTSRARERVCKINLLLLYISRFSIIFLIEILEYFSVLGGQRKRVMIKCKSCGEMNVDTNKFCVSCGSSLSDAASLAMKEALEQAKKGFEKDSLVSIDRSRVTYVCTVCGTVNSIDTSKCTKCGKPRPRSEFVNALRRIRQGQEYSTALGESFVEDASAEQTQAEVQPEQPIQQPIQPQQPMEPHRVENVSMYVGGGGQANAVVQPFVIVPFVNPNQEIWQSRQNQLYRFQPYTQAEVEQIRKDREEQQRALLEAQRLQKLQDEYNDMAVVDDESVTYSKKTKPVRIVSILMIIIAIATIVLAYLMNIYRIGSQGTLSVFYTEGKPSWSILVYANGIVECLKGQFGLDIQWNGLGYTYSGPTDFIAPVAFIMYLLLTLVILIRSAVRALSGYAKRKGWFLPLLALLFFLTGIVGLIQKYAEFTLESIKAFLGDAQIGMYVSLALAVLLLIVSCFCPVNAKVVRNKKNR